MMRRLAGPIALGMTAAALPASASAQGGEFFTIGQIREMCRGETGEASEFRTDAGHRLFAQIQRERCRMYLLGLAESYLHELGEDRNCIAPELSPEEVAGSLARELIDLPEPAGGTVQEAVHDILRARHGCR